jgi:hypothetical protein
VLRGGDRMREHRWLGAERFIERAQIEIARGRIGPMGRSLEGRRYRSRGVGWRRRLLVWCIRDRGFAFDRVLLQVALRFRLPDGVVYKVPRRVAGKQRFGNL